jgi:hypothetical protein
MGRANKRMDVSRGGTAGRFLTLSSDNGTSIVHFNGLTRCSRSCVVASKVAIVCNTAVIDEALGAGEVISPTIQTHQLDKHII